MNQYPSWKYILIIMVIAIGALYALPNLYGEDPAVQVATAKGFDLSREFEQEVKDLLADEQISPNATEVGADRLLLRFENSQQQMQAIAELNDRLGDDYVVAPNLAPATPDWLRAIGGKPMVLGLDLQGGIHFLMQVDMESARRQQLDRYVDDIRVMLRDSRIRYQSVRATNDGVIVQLRSEEDQQSALDVLQRDNVMAELDLEPTAGSETFNLRGTVQEQALIELQRTALEQNITVLRTRVNELGVAEPSIAQQGTDRIVVQLPGVQDTTRAKTIIGRTATLEYRAVDYENNAVGAAQSGRIPPESRLYFDRNQQPVLLKKRLIVSGDQVIGAAAGFDQQGGSPSVSVRLDGVGSKRMLDFTRENVGNPMAVVFIETRPDGSRSEEVISVANVREPFGKSFQTTGLESSEEAGQLALMLRAGALAAPVRIIEERTVGPSLGQDNIDQGFRSVVIGFVLVLIFMAIYYKVFGLVANVALMTNLIMVFGMLSILGATLTLPGIAGIVLTVGMAVDANVLIFERIREELANGVTPQAAIRSGYDKAFSTIADANITTLIAAVVLFTFGTGPIKGFAVTLSLGIVTSMFTAIMLTRALVNLIYGRRTRLKSLSI